METEAWRFQVHTPFHTLSAHAVYEIKGEGEATVNDIIKSGKTDDGFNGIPLDP